MPWKASAAKGKTAKAKSPTAKRQWSKVANSALKRGASEASAIRQASGAVAKRGKRGGKKK